MEDVRGRCTEHEGRDGGTDKSKFVAKRVGTDFSVDNENMTLVMYKLECGLMEETSNI